MKRILITGEKPGTGKTTTTIGIAKEFSSDYRVLCIDTDMFHPSLSEYFGIIHKKGLSEYLRGGASHDDVIFSIDGVDVIGSGERVRCPGELLRTGRIENILNSVDYDFVLIDTPPYGMFREVYLYEYLCDGILLVGEGLKISRFKSPVIGGVKGKIKNISLNVKEGCRLIEKFEKMEV